MSNFNQQEAKYPQPPPAGNGGGPYVMAPPPIGYPTKDDSGWESCKHSSEDTTSRGDGFLKGWHFVRVFVLGFRHGRPRLGKSYSAPFFHRRGGGGF
ncbi:hypothetical protein LIER_14847 [Lithospermum erythrorhizon]|uniref:Uncharacterized protein n=1 Tax=Lithospermum erythrorhizon TaxID=34254 RepID=A0AAV3Q1K5_LITER